MAQLIMALRTYRRIMKHCSQLLELNPVHKINDDFHDISRYLVCFGRFIRHLLPRAVRVPTPFSVDFMIAVPGSSLNADIIKAQLSNYHDFKGYASAVIEGENLLEIESADRMLTALVDCFK